MTKNKIKESNSYLDDLFVEQHEVTDEVVAYYRKHPEELDLIIDKERVHGTFLFYAFVFGIVLTVGCRVLAYFFGDVWGEFVNDVVLDVGSELGIGIFGGAFTAYLFETLQQKQYKENVAFRNAIKAQLTTETVKNTKE
ncbi:MAG: hypothetical protein CSA79_06330 [Thiothrix nivea]|nr:MAG: hypothetical protein CSA79_06330 [Thiothrix nivea]